MLMNLRSFPFSSLICVASAGKLRSISASKAGRFVALESSCFLPSVWRVNAVGSTTLMDKSVSCCGKFGFGCYGFGRAFDGTQILREVGDARADGARIDVIITSYQSIRGLEAIAGDDSDRSFMRRDSALSVEARGDGRRHAARGLRKNAFGLSELLHAGDELHVRDILGPAPVLADHLCRRGTISRIADRKRAGDRARPLRNDVLSSLLHRGRNG